MKFVFFLLATMAAATNALQISGMIIGAHDPNTRECPPAQVDIFFDTCVILSDYGIPVSRHFAETLIAIFKSAAEDVLPTHLPTVSAGCGIAVVVSPWLKTTTSNTSQMARPTFRPIISLNALKMIFRSSLVLVSVTSSTSTCLSLWNKYWEKYQEVERSACTLAPYVSSPKSIENMVVGSNCK